MTISSKKLARLMLPLCTAALCAVGATAAHASLLANGSFEDTTIFIDNTGQNTETVSPGDSTSIPGWTVIGNTTIAWIGPLNPFGLTASPNPGGGSYFLDLTGYTPGGGGGVQQTIATTVGAQYLLTFDLGSSTTFGVQDGVLASAGGISQSFVSSNPGNQPNLWQQESLAFTATGSSTVISLLGNLAQNYIGIDNVAVVETAAPAVPEPASWVMLIAGFAAVGAGLRHRRVGLRAIA